MRTINFLFIAFGLCTTTQASDLLPLTSGGADLWERMALDSAAQRIYIPGDRGVLVTDLHGRRVGEVDERSGVHSVALAPELGIGICSNGRCGTLSLFTLDSLVVEKELRTPGGNPEAVLFDPACRRIFAFNGRGRNATAFDGFGGAVAGSIPLGGRPGTAVADGRGRIFVSLKDTREVLVLDTWKLAVLRRLPVPALEEPSGLALDPLRRRLFVVGANQLLAVLDCDSGEALGTVPIGPGAGAAVCDPATGGAYVPQRDGSIAVVRRDAGSYRVAASIPARRG